MLQLLACLLLTTSALAFDHRGDIPYDGSQYSTDTYPIDYNEFKAPPRNPNSNLYYSFEQIRRDKTSQVDVREEDARRYMNRPKVTTTTRAPDVVESRKPVIVPDVYVPSGRINRWIDPSTTMAPPPPAPSPKWDGFDLDFRQSPFSQYKPEPQPYDYLLKARQPETTVAPVISQYNPEHKLYEYVSKSQQSETAVAPAISQYNPNPRPHEYVSKPQQPEATVEPVITQYKLEPRPNEYVSKPSQPETPVALAIEQYKPEPRPYEYLSKPQQLETTVAPVRQSSEAARYFTQSTGEPYVNQDRASEETTTFTTTTTVKPRMRSKVNSRGSYKFNGREPAAGSAARTLPVQPSALRSPAMPAVRRPPPPVPKLTPWAGDDF